MEGDFFTKSKNLVRVIAAYNPGLFIPLEAVGNSTIKYLYMQNCSAYLIPEDLLDGGLMDLNANGVDFQGSYYPQVMMCAPYELISHTIPDSEVFDYAALHPGYRNYVSDSKFINFNQNFNTRTCVPTIGFISTLASNLANFTISGADLGPFSDYTTVTLSSPYISSVVLNCSIIKPNRSYQCVNPRTMTGIVSLNLRVNNSIIPNPQTTVNVATARPFVTSVSAAPTRGGPVTVTGENLFLRQDAQSYVRVGAASSGVYITNYKILVPFKSFSFNMVSGFGGNISLYINVTNIGSNLATTPTIYYAAPVIFEASLTANIEQNLTISGDNFWNDSSLVSVSIDSQPCPVVSSDFSNIVCKPQIYPFKAGGLPLSVKVNDKTTTGSVYFIDTGICPNQCNSNGNCTVNGCVCFKGFTGPGCKDKIIYVDHNVNKTKPDTTIGAKEIDAILSIVALRELDSNGGLITEYPFNTWAFDNQTENIYIYKTNASSTNITVTVQWFEDASNFSFGGQVIPIGSNTIKYSIEMTNYSFRDKLSTLQLVMSATMSSSESDPCSQNQVGKSTDSTSIQWIKLTVNNRSLYGRFIKTGYIDGRSEVLSNHLLDSNYRVIESTDGKSTSSNTAQTYIGLNIPQYETSIFLDPDFSVLVSDDKPQCKSGLSVGQIAGIVVGAAVFVVIVAIIGAFLLRRKFKIFIDGKKIKMVEINKS
ncbi:hypothetical protein PPL_10685 [Heterostelium album PN500]|uniref:EGF-like domain-containing protein n=1 Tax=Heterostelium pallidum (strain ATCC 26659 / Pp 5 / PN500) TaxID=670386 RepID=D3BRS4_HETP5|nr:hypothetical protein PPL_10685 [Heterostelium album PN500]EFA76106.1 hypothetical protein PPL_10685 [Heterostelium album PN500]|eukprot:XP_020428240.1 hypothetical protein PPL_10685 [Heterostelium album PN500]